MTTRKTLAALGAATALTTAPMTAGMENSVGAGLRASVSLGMGNDFVQFAIGATMQAYQDSKAGFVMPAGPYGWIGMRLKLDGGKHGGGCQAFQ